MANNRSNLDRGRATVKHLEILSVYRSIRLSKGFYSYLKNIRDRLFSFDRRHITIMRVFISLCLGFFVFTVPACMSNGTSDGQALEVHLDNPSVCDGLVWLGTYSSAPSSPVNDDAYYDSSLRESLIFLGGSWYELCQDGAPGVAGSAGSAGAAGNVWSSGTGAAAGGNNGDFYYNTSTYHVWEKITGTWTDLGSIQGGTGASGSAGAAGNVWSSGTGAAAGGNNGDFYYNTSTYHVWEKITGTWTDLGSIQGGTGASGSAGAAGNVWSSGTGAAAGGNNGDFYYNTSTYHVWEKITGTWTDLGSIQGGTGASGSAGAAGNVWSSGTGAAAGGNNGDFYYNTSTYHVWEKITGTWTDLGSIQGATGAAGSTGAAGNVWSSGTGAPSGGNNGDFYYNTSTYHVWEKITGTWTDLGSIQGGTGASGSTMAYGTYSSIPSIGSVTDGSIYVDTDDSHIWQAQLVTSGNLNIADSAVTENMTASVSSNGSNWQYIYRTEVYYTCTQIQLVVMVVYTDAHLR